MRILTANEAWFSFKGISCRDYSVRMVSPPVRLHPARKGEYIDIPGTDGEVWLDGGGHKPTIISVHCIAEDNLNIDAINAWLSGGGELIFGDEPERAYKASITSEYARNNLYGVMRGQEFTVSFDCEPYRYKVGEEYESMGVMVSHPGSTNLTVVNEGTADAWPVFVVSSKNGGGSITIGNDTLVFSHNSKTMYIDCAAKYAYTINDDGSLAFASMYIGGDWPRLAPGTNAVIIEPAAVAGNYITVSVKARWRYL